MELFFKANDASEDKRVPAFLTLVGPKVFALAKSLLSPMDPTTCTYKKIVDTIKNLYKPKVVLIYESFKFYSRAQRSGESLADFVASLKALAHTCDFGNPLTDLLRDRFVMGLSNETTQHTLLAEADLTFEKAVDIASVREAALGTCRRWVERTFTAYRDIVERLEEADARLQVLPAASLKVVQVITPQASITPVLNLRIRVLAVEKCTGKKVCPLKDAGCFSCRKKGHIRGVCFLSK